MNNFHPREVVDRVSETQLKWVNIQIKERGGQSFLILDNHVKNKKYGNFVSISSLTGECAAPKIKTFAVLKNAKKTECQTRDALQCRCNAGPTLG